MLWLLMALLPLQGTASVIKMPCGTRHHQSAVVGVSKKDVPLGASLSLRHVADMPLQTEPPATLESQNAASAKTFAKKNPNSSTCSICASCCVGAIAPPQVLAPLPVPGISKAAISSPSVPYPGHIPFGLERPPKPLLG